ncbi:MAG: hypothetical protein ACYTFI_28175 [Planctomycetota bacterium]|jgi:hypothetical protein
MKDDPDNPMPGDAAAKGDPAVDDARDATDSTSLVFRDLPGGAGGDAAALAEMAVRTGMVTPARVRECLEELASGGRPDSEKRLEAAGLGEAPGGHAG